MLPWPSVVWAASLLQLVASSPSLQKRGPGGGEKKVKPLTVPYSPGWDGSDGVWSSFTLSIGDAKRYQAVRVFPSTSHHQTWLIAPTGCTSDWQGGQSRCEEQRGGIFNANRSGTWQLKSTYAVDYMRPVHLYGPQKLSIEFGWDNLIIGYPGSRIPPLNHMLIGELADYQYTSVGLLGLDPKPSNFTDAQGMGGPHKSFLQYLTDNALIPSLSYGLQVGAPYRDPPQHGSLTLGGYDKNRIESDAAVFPFGPDAENKLVALLVSVKPSSVLPQADQPSNEDLPKMVRIDSTRPFIYLPRKLCAGIADYFGLKFDKDFEWLLVSDVERERLKQNSIKLTFSLGQINTKSHILISLLFDALVQPLDYPYAKTKTWYIPLRASKKDEEMVLGRTFLQEAYLSVDYGRQKFSLYQARFPPAGEPPKLIEIFYDPKNPNDEEESYRKVSKAVLAAVAIGFFAGLSIIMVVVYCVKRRKAQRQSANLVAGKATLNSFELTPASTPGTDPISSSSTLASNSPPQGLKPFEAEIGAVHVIGSRPRAPREPMNVPSRLRETQPVASDIPPIPPIPRNVPLHRDVPPLPYTDLNKPAARTLNPASANLDPSVRETRTDWEEPIIKVYYEMEPPPPLPTVPGKTVAHDRAERGQSLYQPSEFRPSFEGETQQSPGKARRNGFIAKASEEGIVPLKLSGYRDEFAAAAEPRGNMPTLPRVPPVPPLPEAPNGVNNEMMDRWLKGFSGRKKW